MKVLLFIHTYTQKGVLTMLEKTINVFYESLIKSIKCKKEKLQLDSKEILDDFQRVKQILGNYRKGRHRYLIGTNEYIYLNDLYTAKNRNDFLRNGALSRCLASHDEELAKKEIAERNKTGNYDVMLWGHIKWKRFFGLLILELSEIDASEKLGKLFEDTLVDDAEYATIRYDELHKRYGKIYIFPEDRKRIKAKAIQRVHFQEGYKGFKKFFDEKFKGETLRGFDGKFIKVVEEYLDSKTPDENSFGLRAYQNSKIIARVGAEWQDKPSVQYGDMYDEEVPGEVKLLERYMADIREQLYKEEEYQSEFDKLNLFKSSENK